MNRWSAWFLVGIASGGLTTSCEVEADSADDCEDGACEPTAVTQAKLCPMDTHVCVPRVGGGWDFAVRWKGDKASAPDTCPAAAANISFWGNEVLPAGMPPGALPAFVVGCGFKDDASCEDEQDDGSDFVCAPNVRDWPACVVANSARSCPPTYQAQTIVGSDLPEDVQWTVCCPALDPRSP